MLSQSKPFLNLLSCLAHKRGLAEVFNDLVTMGVCSYHSTNIQSQLAEKDAVNEALYLKTAGKYSREELENFAKALGTLSLQVNEEPYSDLLDSISLSM